MCFRRGSSLFLLPTKLVHLSLPWKISDFLRNNNGKWLMVVNLEKSFSMKNCPMVKKILKILYTCLKKDFYYIFLFIKVSVNLSKKKTILKLGNTLKSKSKIGWGGGLLTLGRIFSQFIILKSPRQNL